MSVWINKNNPTTTKLLPSATNKTRHFKIHYACTKLKHLTHKLSKIYSSTTHFSWDNLEETISSPSPLTWFLHFPTYDYTLIFETDICVKHRIYLGGIKFILFYSNHNKHFYTYTTHRSKGTYNFGNLNLNFKDVVTIYILTVVYESAHSLCPCQCSVLLIFTNETAHSTS